MKNCGRIKELIPLSIDKDMDKDTYEAFEEHMAFCGSCREELEEMIELTDALKGIEEVELPPNFKEELHLKLLKAAKGHDGHKRNILPIKKYMKVFSSIAAGLLLVIFVKGFYSQGLFSPKASKSELRMESRDAAAAPKEASGESLGAGSGSDNMKNAGAAAFSARMEIPGSEDTAAIYNLEGGVTGDSETPGTFNYGGNSIKSGTPEAPRAFAASARTVNGGREIICETPGDKKLIRSLNIVVNIEDDGEPGKEAEKIISYAFDNMALNQPMGPEGKISGTKDMELEKEEEADTAPLDLRIPNSRCNQFINILFSNYGQDNLEIGEIICEDVTDRAGELGALYSNLDDEVHKLENSVDPVEQDILNRKVMERNEAEEEIDLLQVNSGYIRIFVTVKKKDTD